MFTNLFSVRNVTTDFVMEVFDGNIIVCTHCLTKVPENDRMLISHLLEIFSWFKR